MQKFALVVAGGKGLRMGSDLPKQFMLLRGRPILMRTLEAFFYFDPQIQIILVLPALEIERWQQLCAKHDFQLPHRLASGGANRTESVRNGLSSIKAQDGLVAIHDGVRPMVSGQLIGEAYDQAATKGNAIASVALKDSIRFDDGYENKALDRSQYRLVQTPQTFKLGLILDAYQKIGELSMTDDASVLEAAGHEITLIEGDYRNLKITRQEDIKIAEALWEEPLHK
mgnify:CR=1 FL=1